MAAPTATLCEVVSKWLWSGWKGEISTQAQFLVYVNISVQHQEALDSIFNTYRVGSTPEGSSSAS